MPYKASSLARFDLPPSEARRLQQQIPSLVVRRDQVGNPRTVAGADISLEEKTGYAAVILYSFPELTEIERVWRLRGINNWESPSPQLDRSPQYR